MVSCPNCNNQATTDPATNDLVCMECGISVEQSRIVSDVTFAETSSGKAVVTGQYVSNDQAGVMGNSLYGLQSGESRIQTIEKARQRMERIGRKLLIHDHIIDGGVRFFRTALTNNFVKGRRSQHVLSACLYLSCRLGNTDHMLLDFAEVLQVNVFNIGATYLQLLKNQNISKLPIVDPTVFIQRFVKELEFPSDDKKVRKVIKDARLLVQRMGKDWLQQGRRPAGVAAACVLLACRMNNYRRSKAEIVKVARIAEETLQRRLDEFKATPAGTLTVSDFRDTNVDSAADPPSFTRHRELEKLYAEKKAREEEMIAQGLDTEDLYLDRELEKLARELDKEDGKTLELSSDVEAVLKIPELQGAYKEMEAHEVRVKELIQERDRKIEEERRSKLLMQGGEDPDSATLLKAEAVAETPRITGGDILSEEQEDEVQKAFLEGGLASEVENKLVEEESELKTDTKAEEATDQCEEDEDSEDIEDSEEDDIEEVDESNTPRALDSDLLDASQAPVLTGTASVIDTIATSSDDTTVKDQPVEMLETRPSRRAHGMGRAEAFLLEFRKKRSARLALEAAAKQEAEVYETKRKELPPDPLDEHLSEVDDEEIESVILNEEEIDIKTRVWMSINREYLINQERKRLRAEADKANGVQKAPRKRRKTEKKTAQSGASTAADSAANMVREKAHSKKINYAAFQNMFKKDKTAAN